MTSELLTYSETPNTPTSEEILEDLSPTNHVDVIETVISSLDQTQSAMVSHSQEGYLWKFNYGSVEVFVQLTGLTDDDAMTVWAEVLPLPANPAPLFAKLLTMNWATTLEARFATLQDKVVIVTSRTLADLSPGEISRAVTIVATLSDDYDDALKAEFAG